MIPKPKSRESAIYTGLQRAFTRLIEMVKLNKPVDRNEDTIPSVGVTRHLLERTLGKIALLCCQEIIKGRLFQNNKELHEYDSWHHDMFCMDNNADNLDYFVDIDNEPASILTPYCRNDEKVKDHWLIKVTKELHRYGS